MRAALMTVSTAVLMGCSGQASPSTPTAIDDGAPLRPVAFSVDVREGPIIRVQPSGDDVSPCIVGATIEIVGGSGEGQSKTQDCQFDWYMLGPPVFFGLTPGGSSMIRASAPGYGAHLMNVELPEVGSVQVVIHLFRTQ